MWIQQKQMGMLFVVETVYSCCFVVWFIPQPERVIGVLLSSLQRNFVNSIPRERGDVGFQIYTICLYR